MGRGLVCENFGDDAVVEQLFEHVADIAHQPYGDGFACRFGFKGPVPRFFVVIGHFVNVFGIKALFDALRIDVGAEEGSPGHGSGQRLSATHAAQTARDEQFAFQVAVEVAVAAGDKSLIGALQNAL